MSFWYRKYYKIFPYIRSIIHVYYACMQYKNRAGGLEENYNWSCVCLIFFLSCSLWKQLYLYGTFVCNFQLLYAYLWRCFFRLLYYPAQLNMESYYTSCSKTNRTFRNFPSNTYNTSKMNSWLITQLCVFQIKAKIQTLNGVFNKIQ